MLATPEMPSSSEMPQQLAPASAPAAPGGGMLVTTAEPLRPPQPKRPVPEAASDEAAIVAEPCPRRSREAASTPATAPPPPPPLPRGSALTATSGRMLVTPKEPPPRMGGTSVGDGAWRLAPLSKEQAYTFFVPFLTKDIPPRLAPRLYGSATFPQAGAVAGCHGDPFHGAQHRNSKIGKLANVGPQITQTSTPMGRLWGQLKVISPAQSATVPPTLWDQAGR